MRLCPLPVSSDKEKKWVWPLAMLPGTEIVILIWKYLFWRRYSCSYCAARVGVAEKRRTGAAGVLRVLTAG